MKSYQKILIYQSIPEAGKQIRAYFKSRKTRVWLTENPHEAILTLVNQDIDLVFIDLHAPGRGWYELLIRARRKKAPPAVVITNRHPDLRRELQAREVGGEVFLRAPFEQEWIDKTLERLERLQVSRDGQGFKDGGLPTVRMPVRVKLTAPYTILAVVFVASAMFLISRYLLDSLRDRFQAQLVDVGKLSSDFMVQQENNLLEDLRLVSNTAGLDQSLLNENAEELRWLVLPLAINNQIPAVDILNINGQSVLGLHHIASQGREAYQADRGELIFQEQEFIRQVLTHSVDEIGDKYAGVIEQPDGRYFYVAGPVYTADSVFAGVVAIGYPIQDLAVDLRQATLAQVNFYSLSGEVIGSSFSQTQVLDSGISSPPVEAILALQDEKSFVREIRIGSSTYTEILGPWEARAKTDIGIIGVALPHNFIVRPSAMTQAQAIGLVLLIFLAVVLLGIILAHQITRPLSRVVKAALQVAQGNFEIKVPSQGNDEISVLAHAFNYMISGLQEGVIYRDLLGRTVSPEIREAMRQSIASGDLRLEGQTAIATVLISDIRSFTSLSEQVPPTKLLDWLNEYFGGLVPVITSQGGVVDKFEGDAILSFFGLLPKPVSPAESAFQACQAAVKMLAVVDKLNQIRAERDEPALVTGIGINTGRLIAGGLGTNDRLNFTILGDTVNTTQRLQEVSRQFGESGIVISENTLAALGSNRSRFLLEPLGEQSLKGKQEVIWLYRLKPLQPDIITEVTR